LGHEDFGFPATWRILDLPEARPDLLHCHNLHGDFFDLRALAMLSHEVPTVLTMHDAWLLSGHCAHSFDCERWVSGCGRCPYPKTYPAVVRDATAYNWKRKANIYKRSRLYVATPSKWLMDKVTRSMLAPALIEARVIPNGVDLAVFKPGDPLAARRALDISADTDVLLFVAAGTTTNPFKDFATLRQAVARVSQELSDRPLLFVGLGADVPSERIGRAELRFIPFTQDRQTIVNLYQAADVYLHAAKADTFPTAVLEALACGTPVIGTAVGGIPEQIDHGRTGFLTPPGDAEAMAAYIKQLLTDRNLHTQFGSAAAEDAARRFGVPRQVRAYLDWFEEIRARPVSGG
jgi:glycosyltransferase involved in cell wall biosynthesis